MICHGSILVQTLQAKRQALFGMIFLGMGVGLTNAAPPAAEPARLGKIEFNADVRPILSGKCFACHGFDEHQRQADLRLDTFEGATQSTGGRPAIVPGRLEESELWSRITSGSQHEVMPPPDSHQQLTSAEIQTLRRWIEQGAEYQQHWSFEPIKEVPPPGQKVAHGNAIDQFIRARLETAGLQVASEADRETLLRRVAFALTGLPPTSEERVAYLNDTVDGAYERMVDRYLNSIRFGEEMARHWLDVARYADTHGMHLDNERQMWAYRDWVINAFNANQPFDQFTIEQLAGDLLPDPSMEQLIATGFNRCNVTTSEGGSINEELLYRYAVDRASTTFQAWLGLTGGCAVCHDHKFDPISAREFYSFYAFFNSAADPGFDGNALLTAPTLKLETEEARVQLASLAEQLAGVQAELEMVAASLEYVDPGALDPQPSSRMREQVWLDDRFPETGVARASPGHPLQFVTVQQAAPVFSGVKSLKRTDRGLAQDVWDQAQQPLLVPTQASLFAHVYLDPENLPRSIMLQYHKDGWQHRAVWGDYDAIDWGKAGTIERVHMGPLPVAGRWVKLEFPAERLGLNAGDALTGFALTQYGGTVYWDKMGVAGISDPANDPQHSFMAWWKQRVGQENKELPESLRNTAKLGPGADGVDELAMAQLRAYYLQEICVDTQSAFAAMIEHRTALEQRRKTVEDSIPSTFVYRDLDRPRPSFIMVRGAYDQPGEAVQPGVPAILPALKRQPTESSPATRLDLARWLVEEENPLTARVAVNRLWQQFFGTGLVKTSYDFGSQGELPSHPELLDWLARDFQRSGWDVKRMVRQLVCSATFRQDARISAEVLARDPQNRLLARGPRFRLDAEQIRDNALFVGGLIDLKMGGKGVKPYQPENIWEPVGFAGSNTRFYQRDAGSALYRRSVYTFYKRTAPPPFMVNFDAPNREQSCMLRDRSNTPLQALQLMNDIQHIEAARGLAQRMLSLETDDRTAQIAFAFETILARHPSHRETEIVLTQWDQHLERYRVDPTAAKELIALGETPATAGMEPSRLAAATLVANMLLNLDETLTRN
jgi:hypothetical protein